MGMRREEGEGRAMRRGRREGHEKGKVGGGGGCLILIVKSSSPPLPSSSSSPSSLPPPLPLPPSCPSPPHSVESCDLDQLCVSENVHDQIYSLFTRSQFRSVCRSVCVNKELPCVCVCGTNHSSLLLSPPAGSHPRGQGEPPETVCYPGGGVPGRCLMDEGS